MILVPILTLLMGLDIKTAIPASLFSVVATSVGASGHYLRREDSQISIAAFLEPWALLGAVGAAFLSTYISGNILQVLFAFFLVASAWSMLRTPQKIDERSSPPSNFSRSMKLTYDFQIQGERKTKYIDRPLLGGFSLVFAGALSALLGIGGGIVKVLIMNRVMGVPLRTATATSNLMIGLTASAGAAVYLFQDKVEFNLAIAMALGVLIGSWAGGKIAPKVKTESLKFLFLSALILAAIEMLRKSFL